jgi:hypothetical protein
MHKKMTGLKTIRPQAAAPPEVVGEAGPARLFELDDVSSRPEAATCRRTPQWPSG